MKLINGWTKETVMAQVKKYNNGSKSMSNRTDGDFSCVYETENGNRCAVGCFIPDNHMSLTNDFIGGAGNLLREYPDLASFMPFEVEGLLSLQNIHDGACEGTIHQSVKKWLDDVLVE